MKRFKVYLFFFLSINVYYAQKVLRIIQPTPASDKTYELYVNDVVEYKLKGQHHFKKDIILNMNEDFLLLQKDSLVNVKRIKTLRFKRASHLLGTVNAVCFIGGVGYPLLNLANNALLQNTFALDKRALYIGAAFISAGIIIKMMRIKYVRIRKNTYIKISDQAFEKIGK